MYTTLETPTQPNYNLGPPYTNTFGQAPYYNYRHYSGDVVSSASSYGFHRADGHPQPFNYDGLSKTCRVWERWE